MKMTSKIEDNLHYKGDPVVTLVIMHIVTFAETLYFAVVLDCEE